MLRLRTRIKSNLESSTEDSVLSETKVSLGCRRLSVSKHKAGITVAHSPDGSNSTEPYSGQHPFIKTFIYLFWLLLKKGEIHKNGKKSKKGESRES